MVDKLFFQLIKILPKITGLSKEKILDFLSIVFNESNIYNLNDKQQTIILKNLILYLNTLVSGLESKKKINHNINSLEILNHIEGKVISFVELFQVNFNLKNKTL